MFLILKMGENKNDTLKLHFAFSAPAEAGHQTGLSSVPDVCEEDRRCWNDVRGWWFTLQSPWIHNASHSPGNTHTVLNSVPPTKPQTALLTRSHTFYLFSLRLCLSESGSEEQLHQCGGNRQRWRPGKHNTVAHSLKTGTLWSFLTASTDIERYFVCI